MSCPRFSIVTPTLQRQSLTKCCESVTNQTFKDWQHIVIADVEKFDVPLMESLEHDQRIIVKCGSVHRNYGNTCRHNAWALTVGEYVLYLDDDNFLADDLVLEDIASGLTENWGLFPILRHGQRFYTDPPRCCHADTANIVVRREIGQWPDGPEYTMDGIWIEALVKNHPNYQAFPDFRPIVVMEKSNEGR